MLGKFRPLVKIDCTCVADESEIVGGVASFTYSNW